VVFARCFSRIMPSLEAVSLPHVAADVVPAVPGMPVLLDEQALLRVVVGTNMACGDERVPGIARLPAVMREIHTHFWATCKQSDAGGLRVGDMFHMDFDDTSVVCQPKLLRISPSSSCYLLVNLWVSVEAWLPGIIEGENVDLSAVPNSIRQLIGYEQSTLSWNEYITIQDLLNYYRVVLVEIHTPLRDVWTAISLAEGWNPMFHLGHFSTQMSSDEVDEDCTVEEFCHFARQHNEPFFPCVHWPESAYDTGASASYASSQTAETEQMYDSEEQDIDDMDTIVWML